MSDLTASYFNIIAHEKKCCFDYTPRWKRGNPSSYIDSVTFPMVLTNQSYDYRVVRNNNDLGTRPAYDVESDGSQKVNFLEYNSGYGIPSRETISVYLVDPDTGDQCLVARWN